VKEAEFNPQFLLLHWPNSLSFVDKDRTNTTSSGSYLLNTDLISILVLQWCLYFCEMYRGEESSGCFCFHSVPAIQENINTEEWRCLERGEVVAGHVPLCLKLQCRGFLVRADWWLPKRCLLRTEPVNSGAGKEENTWRD